MHGKRASQTSARTLGSLTVLKAVILTAGLVLVMLVSLTPGLAETTPEASARRSGPPAINHVFVINLGNKGFKRVWGPESGAPYLSETLRSQGVLLSSYYSIAASSLPNYIAQISGQAPNTRTMKNCAVYAKFNSSDIVPPDQLVGSGCIYPSKVQTVAGQLTAAGKSWKAYMEDMKTPCRHPAPGAADESKEARVGDQYVTRHNPFVYFEEVTESPLCQTNVVDLSALRTDLGSLNSTPNLSYITPNMCNDGHDKPCVNGRSGGMGAVDGWLKQWIPLITGSPAFQQGMVIITSDTSDEKDTDDSSAGPGPNDSPTLPGGTAGGLVGALVLSPYVQGGSSSDVVYNHYSLLGSIEDLFSLPHLGYAGAFGQNRFGDDVYTAQG